MHSLPGLIIDPADASNVATVEALLDAAAVWQQSRGSHQWRPGQFGEEVRRTIANGDLYVARQGGVVIGCFMLDDGSPRMTQWLVEHDRTPTRGVLGRLAVTREMSGQGLGLEILNAASTIAAQGGIAFLRLECPAENERLRRYYVEAGFSHCGDNDTPGPNGEHWVTSMFERPTGVG